MIITTETERAEVTVTSLKRGLMCSFNLKVTSEMDSNRPVAHCYLERLHFKARSGHNMKSKSR